MNYNNTNIANTKVVLEIKDLHKSFGDKHVLNGFNMLLHQGENLVIMGKSGSGKSVMIKCLVGLMEADSGTISVMQNDITKLNQEALDILRADIGFLFQGSALYDSMTVRENLEFPLRRHIKKFNKTVDTEKLVIEALENVGLVSAINLMPDELSGGMKRRVALARTLILQPKIILYDEPTSGLDPITAKEIIILMQEVQKKYNTSSLIITHDVDCARVISDRMILLIDGIDYAVGTFKELSTSQDPKVKAFFKQ
ncbi:ABC transporter ATP-binding protein [Jejuia pallidilutea]|uniref:Methionine ABC transporter ATP-binding protein n=1 Tax=Jejuia pallidilutea TaxID=504487 RepID=A0A090WZS7_9FLAO|nr:ATP-binding cassette domain-containing protein [Jejuia pallidilutea]GAL68717.1 methionine ABC transporter ATP-binding protein [Jejuia pallidilutea]GAL72867.1 methionine ABC transporter ATP-binding protein [Jejuia pallidilutea]GAL90303.1 methionine ABC transporter ATP-binding protein [Jejuia pallidilutea]